MQVQESENKEGAYDSGGGSEETEVPVISEFIHSKSIILLNQEGIRYQWSVSTFRIRQVQHFLDLFFSTGNFYFFLILEKNANNIPNLPVYDVLRMYTEPL
jgi:hypothetical protein